MSLTDEQKRLRATGYSASEISALVQSGWKRKIELYEAKVNPQPDDDEDPALAMELGVEEEEPTARVYARRTGTFLHTVGTLRHPTHPLILATPDRARFTDEDAWRRAAWKRQELTGNIIDAADLEEADRLLEVKTHAARFRRDYGKAGSGEVMEHEAIQVMIQMACTGHRLADIAVLFRGDFGVKLEVFTVGYNAEVFDWLAESVERFHQDHVLARKPPEPDGSEEYDEVLGRMHSRPVKLYREASVVEEELIERYAMLEQIEARAGHYRSVIGQTLKQQIGDVAGLQSVRLGKLSWINVRESSTVDWKKASADYRLLAEECLQAFDILGRTGEQLSPENRAQLVARLKAVEIEAAKPKAGFRYLRHFAPKDLSLETKKLTTTLDPIEKK